MKTKPLIPFILTAAVLLTALPGCGARSAPDQGEGNSKPLAQGVSGRVTKKVGDFQCCPATGETFPLSVPVHVISGTVPYSDAGEPPDLADLSVEASVVSSSDGSFSVGLYPGTYTVFAEIEGSLYRNCNTSKDDTSIYCDSEVKSGVFLSVHIEDTSEATF